MKTTRFLAMIVVLVMAITAFSACDISDIFPSDNPPDPVIPGGQVTVTYRQGQKVLKEEKLDAGLTASNWTPNVEGKEFIGWYSDPGCTKAFDFTQLIMADTDIYASFKSNGGSGSTGTDDPVIPDFYLVGSGKGDLSQSGWDHNNSAKYLGMKGNTTGVYTITINMYAGDMFQICHDLSWDGQVGLGHIKGAAALEDDPNNGQVLDEEGNAVFTGTMEYDNPIEKWNITLADGQDGKYEFSYDSASGVLTWKLIEKLDPSDIPEIPVDPNATIPVTLYFKNTDAWTSVNLYSWITVDGVTTNFAGVWPGSAMTKVEGTEDWYYIQLKVSTLEGLNIIFNGSGGQTDDLSYDAEKIYWANSASYATQAEADEATLGYVPAPTELYVRGLGGDWGTPEDKKLTLGNDGSYSIILALSAGDVFKVADGDWSNGNVYGWHDGLDGECFKEAASDGNIEVVVADVYLITVTKDGVLTIEPDLVEE